MGAQLVQQGQAVGQCGPANPQGSRHPGQGGNAFREALPGPLHGLGVLDGGDRIAAGLCFFVGVLDGVKHGIFIAGIDHANPHPGRISVIIDVRAQRIPARQDLNVPAGFWIRCVDHAGQHPARRLLPALSGIIQGTALVIG